MLMHYRRDALQVLTIATLVVGFVLFENPFTSGITEGHSLLSRVLRIATALCVVIFYLMTMASVVYLHLRASFTGPSLLRVRRFVFLSMSGTIVFAAIFSWWSNLLSGSY